jgi:hypothetical protein
MHGLINRSLQSFLRDTYGAALWTRVAEAAGVGPDGFEAMLVYDDALTDAVIAAAAAALDRPGEALLEDLGIHLVSLEPLRRLLRFGGVDYVDFLYSLDELPDRARLAVADLGLPDLRLEPTGDAGFALTVGPGHPGFAPVFAGILRAMADDYGAFALVDLAGPAAPGVIRIELLAAAFAEGRSFQLGRPEVV